MKKERSILASKTIRILPGITGQKQSTTPLQLYTTTAGYIDIGTTSDISFATLFTQTHTIDFNGSIDVLSIFLFIYTNNDANAECKLQISGDTGNTFVDMTDAIGTGIDLNTRGPGTWINSVAIGNDGLQIRILGRSTDGNPATVRLYGYYSTINMLLSKKLV